MINNIQPASAGPLIESPLLLNKKTIVDDKSDKKTIAYHQSNLLRSAYEGNLRNVKATLDLHPSLINEVGDIREATGTCYVACTALHLSVRAGHKEVSFELVRRGAKLDIQNELGDAPLTYADARFRELLIACRDKYA